MRSLFLVPFILFLITFNIYVLVSPGETDYNYFSRLSQSFINGKLYLNENPPWLNELIPVDHKYYVVYPPMPSILLLPFVLFFGISSQTLFSILLGAMNVALVYLILRKLNFSKKNSILVSIFFGFGTNQIYLSSVGSAWYLAHIVAIFFLLLALLETFSKQRLILIGFLIGAAFWSRTPVVFTSIFFYLYLWKKFWPLSKKSIRNFLYLSFGIGLFIILDGFYNYIRFGNFSPFVPYYLIPNLDKDPVFNQGFTSLSFIPRHLEAIFLKLPKFILGWPFIIPSLYATAIWFTSPAIILIIKAKKSLLAFSAWLAILSTFFIIITWAGVGYSQWGYRFVQDFMPFILILMSLGIGNKPAKYAYFLVGLSIFITSWGTILINKFGVYFI